MSKAEPDDVALFRAGLQGTARAPDFFQRAEGGR
jgi:hypothetical protein